MKMITDNIKAITTTIISISAALGVIWGMIGFVDGRYAHATYVQSVENRVTLNELKQLYRDALENLYFYRGQVRKYPEDVELQRRLADAEKEVKDIKAQIDQLTKKKGA